MGRSGTGSILLKAFVPWMIAGFVGATGVRGTADEPASKARDASRSRRVLKVAESYFVLLDDGKYAESWQAAAVGLRKSLPQRKWVDALTKSRSPFGKLQSRKLDRVEMVATEAPERIDQAWVYSELRFTSDESCSELAIVYLENGTEWKVSGYFLGNPESFPKPKSSGKAAASAKN